MPVADIRNLTVKYGDFTALHDFTMQIPEGCVGLLGPNGAGKTTLLKTLLGFVAPANGTGTVVGANITTEGHEVRRRVGYMPEQDCHIPGMSGVAFVAYAGELGGLPSNQALRRAHEVLEYCGLGEARYRKVETYSTGMKQRIKLAQALVHGPKLLLLDEPTNGLDPRGRDEMLALVRDVSHGKGVNVLICSHLLPDIEKVADHIMVIFQGKLQATGSLAELTKLDGVPVDIELREPNQAFLDELFRRGAFLMTASGSNYRIQCSGSTESVTRMVFESARIAGAQVRSIKRAQRSLEEAFLQAIQ
jgi:ABC-2 type transport system ATP-binding protein